MNALLQACGAFHIRVRAQNLSRALHETYDALVRILSSRQAHLCMPKSVSGCEAVTVLE